MDREYGSQSKEDASRRTEQRQKGRLMEDGERELLGREKVHIAMARLRGGESGNHHRKKAHSKDLAAGLYARQETIRLSAQYIASLGAAMPPRLWVRYTMIPFILLTVSFSQLSTNWQVPPQRESVCLSYWLTQPVIAKTVGDDSSWRVRARTRLEASHRAEEEQGRADVNQTRPLLTLLFVKFADVVVRQGGQTSVLSLPFSMATNSYDRTL